MTCGEKYARIWLVTADGQTPDQVSITEAGSLLGSEAGDWISVARKIADHVRTRWNRVSRSASAQSHLSADHAGRVKAYFTRVEDLPSSYWTTLSLSSTVRDDAIITGREGCCLAELLDDVIRRAGLPTVQDPVGPAPRPGLFDGLGAGLRSAIAPIALAVGIGLVLTRGEDDGP
jgi:hypothetical protein